MVNNRRTIISEELDKLATSAPGIVSDTPQTSAEESSQTITHPTGRTTQATRLSALEARIKQLEEELALQQREKELERLIRENRGSSRNPPDTQDTSTPARDNPNTPSSRQQSSGSSSSSNKGEVKAKNIITLEYPTTFRKRDKWLDDMDRSFKGARRRYRTNRN
ncbi:hypothetical protein Forpe1208_v002261 [Fusarium oxysporum f. sp. rapae]|uniref:Uncharacterized protein n=1 Tax=Fusarium oxysporum f. sp. rapae TaxID=485398 RepID=A0A8J5PGJ1_FUSOX|nr:hypothetical protein Forpe1208_v002261 [Fusarium oxysporum f. sp. rapae]